MSTINEGTVSIKLADGMQRMVDRLLADSGRVTLTAMETTTEELFQAARSKWPEKTGASKRALRKYVKFGTSKLVVGITNDAPYAWYIKIKGTRRRVWNELVAKPGRKVGRRMAKDAGAALVKKAAG